MSVESIRDEVVGELTFRDGWERQDSIRLFDKVHDITVVFEGEPGERIDDSQRKAYSAFDSDRDVCFRRAEQALLEYYQGISAEVRMRLGETADQLAPLVAVVADLSSIMTPTHVSFPLDFPDDGRVMGLILDCTWDPGRGVGVRLVDERVREVGTQDVIL